MSKNLLYFTAVAVVLFFGVLHQRALAQQATGTIFGTVKDITNDDVA